MAAFERLIRFQADDGKIVYGNLEKEIPTRDIQGSQVEVLDGDVKSGFKKTGGKATVSKLLSPLPTTNIILCVGLNYRQHAEECNVRIHSQFRGRSVPTISQSRGAHQAVGYRLSANFDTDFSTATNTRKSSNLHEAQ